MRACSILLLGVVVLLEAVTTTLVSGQTKLESGASPETPQSLDIAQTDDNTKRALGNNWTTNVAFRSPEERGVPGFKKIRNGLKIWVDKDRKFVQMLTGGAAKDSALFAKLYTKKAIPSRMFTKMKLSELSVAEKKTDEAYLKWAAYFDYWVDRNTGKIKA
ncbi:hypothetical protein PRIC1_006677 [Phytophthora ramorum]|uniref:RxLR effector protein n=1 Tax=Phytophthora ramorum TaxID=164328 RepID=H3GVT1_PHYRM|nr:hypothetical protein KRP23_12812 [Phytophthora ramorum]KAH7505845.1 hypothetical protein KRP22_3815 [Phytophthora ramorum]